MLFSASQPVQDENGYTHEHEEEDEEEAEAEDEAKSDSIDELSTVEQLNDVDEIIELGLTKTTTILMIMNQQ